MQGNAPWKEQFKLLICADNCWISYKILVKKKKRRSRQGELNKDICLVFSQYLKNMLTHLVALRRKYQNISLIINKNQVNIKITGASSLSILHAGVEFHPPKSQYNRKRIKKKKNYYASQTGRDGHRTLLNNRNLKRK